MLGFRLYVRGVRVAAFGARIQATHQRGEVRGTVTVRVRVRGSQHRGEVRFGVSIRGM